MTLPANPGVEEFDALQEDARAWREAICALALAHGCPPDEVHPANQGTVLVARLARERVLKLYPPFLRDHFEFERAALEVLHGRLRLPTPRLLASGSHEGWPYLLMTQLHGEPLTQTWPTLNERERCALLLELGALARQVHELPAALIAPLVPLAPRWSDFIATQRAQCLARQQRRGLAPHLLAQVPEFIAGALPEGEPVLLTGEYTPMNLFTRGARLAAMFDFGDGLVGPRAYDWLGPLCFLAAGHAERCAAFMAGTGVALTEALRLQLLRQLLLHRYSNPPAQIACPGWQEARSFEEVAARIWPLAA